MSEDSLVETCFFFRSGNELRKKTASTRRGTPWSDMMTPKPPAANFFPLSPQEPPSRVHWRNDAWESTTRVMEHTAQRTLESFHQEAFARVENFVRNPKPGAEIPTVLVYAGLNISDHALSFQHLAERLARNVTPYVADLTSHECASPASALHALTTSIVSRHADAAAARWSNADSAAGSHTRGLRRSTSRDRRAVVSRKQQEERKGAIATVATQAMDQGLTPLQQFAAWYNLLHGPARARPEVATDVRPPVIVLLEQSESIAPHVLEEIILALSQYVESDDTARIVPWRIVMGISTTAETFHARLRLGVAARLDMQRVLLSNPLRALDNLLEALLASGRLPLSLPGTALTWLLEHTLQYSLSAQSLLHALRFALLEHFAKQPWSFLACPLPCLPSSSNAAGADDLSPGSDRIPQAYRYQRAHRLTGLWKACAARCQALSSRDLRDLGALASVQREAAHVGEPAWSFLWPFPESVDSLTAGELLALGCVAAADDGVSTSPTQSNSTRVSNRVDGHTSNDSDDDEDGDNAQGGGDDSEDEEVTALSSDVLPQDREQLAPFASSDGPSRNRARRRVTFPTGTSEPLAKAEIAQQWRKSIEAAAGSHEQRSAHPDPIRRGLVGGLDDALTVSSSGKVSVRGMTPSGKFLYLQQNATSRATTVRRVVVTQWLYRLNVHRLALPRALQCLRTALPLKSGDETTDERFISRRYLFTESLAQPLQNTPLAQRAANNIAAMSAISLRRTVSRCRDILAAPWAAVPDADLQEPWWEPFSPQVEFAGEVAQLTRLLAKVDNPDEEDEEEPSTTAGSRGTRDSVTTPGIGRMGPAKRRRMALSAARKAVAVRDPLEAVRNGVIQWLRGFIRDWLAPITSLPMHETVVVDSLDSLHDALGAKPRSALIQALRKPSHYLEPRSTVQESALAETLHDTDPDSSILYRLFEHGGRLVNLHDWFQAFRAVVDPESTDDPWAWMEVGKPQFPEGSRRQSGGRGRGGLRRGVKRSRIGPEDRPESSSDEEAPSEMDDDDDFGEPTPKRRRRGGAGGGRGGGKKRRGKGRSSTEEDKDGPSATILARFSQGVKELRWIGLLRPSGRKTDHVQRTVFDPLDV